MTLQVGDKVVVFNAGTDYSRAVKIEPVEVGEKVTVVTLSDGTKIPLPRIDLDLSDYVFVIPKWDLPFKIGGDISWELMTLGAAVFTITGTDCTGVFDANREWGETELTNKILIPVTGRWKGHYYRILSYADKKYTIIRETDQNGLSIDFSEGVKTSSNGAPVPSTIGALKIQIKGSTTLFERKSSILFTLPDIWWARKLVISWRGRLNMPSWSGGTSGKLILSDVIELVWETLIGDTGLPAEFFSEGYPGYIASNFTILPRNPQFSTLEVFLQTLGNNQDAFIEISSIMLMTDDCPGRDFVIGDKYLIYDPLTKKLIFNDAPKEILTSAYWRDVVAAGEEISTTPVEYLWDGQGYVYLSSSKTTFAQILFDNEIQVVGTAAGESKVVAYHAGSSVTYEGETVSSEMVNITPCLRAGKNSIVISAKDTNGSKVGFPTPVYIKRNMAALH
jgi:hypothetical protein